MNGASDRIPPNSRPDRHSLVRYGLLTAGLIFGLGLEVDAQAPAVSAPEAVPIEFRDPLPPDPGARAAEYVEAIRNARGLPGVSMAVAHRGRLVFSHAAGYADLDNLVPATPSTIYNVGSLSKAMAAVAVMQLVERGDVALDDDVRKYVPSFPNKGSKISIWHLLTHTSGIRHYNPDDFPQGTRWDNVGSFDSIEEAITLFKDDPLLFEPGSLYHYSSYATNLLQGVVETASGLDFEEYMRRRVWGPAGMLHSSFDRPERIVRGRARGYELRDGQTFNYYPNENVTYKFAGGGMLSSVEDLVRFGVALLEGRLLKPATVDQMFTPQLEGVLDARGDGPPRPLHFQQLLMWRVRTDEAGREYVNHCGSVKGYNACLVLYPDEELVAANADNADVLGLRPSRRLADIFRQAAR